MDDLDRDLERARAGDSKAFEALVRPHRRSLEAHAYRMLGSLADAEDAVQEALLRAWKGLAGWEERASLKTWLHRITTNVCIDASNKRGARVLSQDAGPPSAAHDPPRPPGPDDPLFVDPAPPDLWHDLAGESSPEATISARESVRIAFVCAIQKLPASQRAVLLLREVMGWSAQEVADLLEMTVPAVNSALQRARATLDAGADRHLSIKRPKDDETMRALVGKYVRAWESGAPDLLASVLREDAILTMPPMPAWYSGRESIVTFGGWLVKNLGELKWQPIEASGDPAVACWEKKKGSDVFAASSIHVLRFEGEDVVEVHAFLRPDLFPRFGLPMTL